MNRLIPKHDYFKHTTRVMLTEGEKQETIDAVERAGQYLGRMSSMSRMEFTRLGNDREVLASIHNGMKYFGRWVNLIKGSTQPRHLYRHRRRFALDLEARKIAEETGADYPEVRDLFIKLMDKYVGE